jgi:hypothetical protein
LNNHLQISVAKIGETHCKRILIDEKLKKIQNKIAELLQSFSNSTEITEIRLGSCYQVCQRLWPSLTFADEDIKPQNFWASSKSHVATTHLCMHFCGNYIGWSNQGKYYEISDTHGGDLARTWVSNSNVYKGLAGRTKAQTPV